MNFQTALINVPPSEWQTKQLLILDWLDGPIEGICHLVNPAYIFFFTIVAEQINPEGLDDRLFLIGAVEDDAIDKIVSHLDEGWPTGATSFTPSWQFSSKDRLSKAEAQIEHILSNVKPEYLIVRTENMREFTAVWKYNSRLEFRSLTNTKNN
jgi:hypothetical protein